MRVGAIDIGSNSLRLYIADITPESVEEVSRRVVVTRLGEDLDRTGSLSAAAIERSLVVLSEFRVAMDETGVERHRAVGTAACRDAKNSSDFIRSATEVLGASPDVISGAEEAELSFAGATLSAAHVPTLVIDVGGASTEFAAGLTNPEFVRSVKIGSVRLTDWMSPARPLADTDVRKSREHVAEHFSDVELPEVEAVIGVAGTFTTLAAIHLDLPAYDRAAVHGTALSRTDLEGLVDRLAKMTTAEIASIPSMDPARAPVILGGSIVALAALARSRHDRLEVSETDLLDAVALRLAGR